MSAEFYERARNGEPGYSETAKYTSLHMRENLWKVIDRKRVAQDKAEAKAKQ